MWRGLVLFLFWFCSHARCGCCSICSYFQVVQVKHIDWKMNTKNMNICNNNNNYNFGQLHTQENKATKKQIVRLQLNEKKSKESQTKLMSWYWKRKLTWRKDLITYNIRPWIMFSFNWLVVIWRGGCRLKLDVQGQGGGRILDVDGHGGWVVLKIGQFS